MCVVEAVVSFSGGVVHGCRLPCGEGGVLLTALRNPKAPVEHVRPWLFSSFACASNERKSKRARVVCVCVCVCVCV